jgi:hypothetical protein
MLLTVIIVLSGIVGRYIFTAIPRTADGAEMETVEIEQHIRNIEGRLDRWRESRPKVMMALSQSLRSSYQISRNPILSVFGRSISEVGYQIQFWRARRKLQSRYRTQADDLEKLLKRKRILNRQISSIILARRLLSIWHTVHIPIGVALFMTAFIHMIGAIYYATLLR